MLGYGRDGDRLVVIASDNGAPAAPAWYEQQQSLTKREIPIVVLERS